MSVRSWLPVNLRRAAYGGLQRFDLCRHLWPHPGPSGNPKLASIPAARLRSALG
ncbi:MAG TPA: hypothetical protein VMY43_11410 [Methanothrix sp.]|nr:hypothetical protein [Methanothrix sp.]